MTPSGSRPIRNKNAEAKLLFPAKPQWPNFFSPAGLKALAARALAYGRANQADLVKGIAVGCAGLFLIVLSDSIGPAQRDAADPIARMIKTAQGDLSVKGLRRVAASMSPYAQSTSERLTAGGVEWTPRGPEGWPIYDLGRLPTLLQQDLNFEEAREFNSHIAVSDTALGEPKPFLLPATTGQERVRAEECLSQAVYYESGFESGEGQEAVAQVVLNRLRHPAFPKSVCGVVYQGSSRATGCQFSFTCDGSLSRAPSATAWARSQFVARQALNGFVYRPVGTSTHYHADYVYPYWAPTLVKLRQIGAHIFYRMTGPSGAVAAFDGRYAGGETVLSPEILNGGDARTPNAPTVRPADILPEAAPPQTVTITLGGETKTYVVGAPAGQAPATSADASAGIAGTLSTVRRKPTAAEIAEINEKLRLLEEQQKARAESAAPVSSTPAP